MYPQSTCMYVYKKNIKNVLLKILNFYNIRKTCILLGQVFVMIGSISVL